MVNYLVFPEINDEHGFPGPVNRGIANSPEMQEELDERVLAGLDSSVIRRTSDGSSRYFPERWYFGPKTVFKRPSKVCRSS